MFNQFTNLMAFVLLIFPLYLYISFLSFHYYIVKYDNSDAQVKRFVTNLPVGFKQMYSCRLNEFLEYKNKNNKRILLITLQRSRLIAAALPAITGTIAILFSISELVSGNITDIFETLFGLIILGLLMLSFYFGINLQSIQ